MQTMNSLYFEVVSVFVFLFIPWHGQIPSRASCPRDRASLVRKVVTKKWLPILDKVGATLPLQCPLHPTRDLFFPLESRKRHPLPKWTCGFCGQSFHHESLLDDHLEHHHADNLNSAEDAVCLADFCDVLRCEVLQERLRELEELTPTATALDVWHKPLIFSSLRRPSPGNNAIERASPRSLMKTSSQQSFTKGSGKGRYPSGSSEEHPKSPSSFNPHKLKVREVSEQEQERAKLADCSKKDADESCRKQETYNDSGSDNGVPTELPIHPLHSWMDTCSEEHLAELRAKCQLLIQQCVSGLVLNLTLSQVHDVEVAFHRAVCWYLTCERYWEAGTMEPPDFPWGICAVFVLLLTLGVSLCYYIVWVLFDRSSQDTTLYTPLMCETRKFTSEIGMGSDGINMTQLKSNPAITQGAMLPHGSSLGRSMTRSPRYCPTESENECRDSGFNEGGLYPEYDQQEVPPESNSYLARHYSEDSRLAMPSEEANPRFFVHEERVYNYASSFTPNYEQRRLRRNRYNYLDDFDSYSEVDGDGVDSNGCLDRERSDSFIYVSYPPEVKKRFQQNR